MAEDSDDQERGERQQWNEHVHHKRNGYRLKADGL
jgi:hypothetical protein